MADLSEINSSGSTKIVGSDSSGVEQTPVQSTSNGGLHTNLRDSSGNELESFDLDNTGGTSKILGVTLRTLTNGTPVQHGTAGDPIRIDPTGTTAQPISAASLPLPAGASTSANQTTELTRIGDLTETAPANDTASSGLNGRLQRIAQRITSLIAVFNPLTSAPTSSASGIVVRPVVTEYPTFSVVAANTAVGNNKSMLAIQNTGSAVVRIREVWIINDRNTAVTGVAGLFEVRRIASFTGGTSLTPVSYDTADSLPAGITTATGSTVSTETTLLRSGVWSTDEWGPGTSDVESNDHAIQNTIPFWAQTPQGKALTIRQNEAVHVKFATNSTAGAFNIRLVFTTE